MITDLTTEKAPMSITEGAQRHKILDSSWLKIIAMISMTIDHVGVFILSELEIILLSFHGYSLSLAYIARCIGRIAFPLYAFLIAEGFRHTRNRKKYALNMAIFAVVSEIPYNLVYSGTLRYSVQNVYFTLLLGLLMIWAYEGFKNKPVKRIMALIALFAIAVVINASHTYTGAVLILLMYLMSSDIAPLSIIGTALQPKFMYCSILGYLPIYLYNGQRGFIRGKAAKYFFYIFYPAHLLVLYFIKLKLFGY